MASRWPAGLQSRRGSLIQGRFPELVDAAAQMSDGLVLDGELIVWAAGQMSFEALQRRAVSGGRTAARLAREMPAHFIAFDLLQVDGQELLHVPYGERRAQLEELFTDRGLRAPWTLCPETTEAACKDSAPHPTWPSLHRHHGYKSRRPRCRAAV